MHLISTHFSLGRGEEGQIDSIKFDCNRIGLIWEVSLASNACRVRGVKTGREDLLKNGSSYCGQIWGVVRDQAAMHNPQAMGTANLHLRTCTLADVPQCFVSQEQLDGSCRNLVCS